MAKETPRLLIADENNRIYDVPFLEATGMKGGRYFRLDPRKLVKLHPDSELFLLPSRAPVGHDPGTGEYISLKRDAFSKKDRPCYAVAAFLAPGYAVTYSASYAERGRAGLLPLFSYAAVAYYKGGFYAAGMRVDREKRQELAGMDPGTLNKNVKKFRKLFPKNRLVRHLEKCALEYCCPAAKNFFLKRYEGPLPMAPGCNARCVGCISYQPGGRCPVTQPRIDFVPTADEIAEVAVFHIGNVKDPVVSFGQGCEGEPLTEEKVLVEAVKLIRRSTRKGIVNLNTNASKPDVIGKLFDEGMDSIRVSMNSARKPYYTAYYKPRGYSFNDVLRSIRTAKKKGGFVSVNYLIMPGFTDSRGEVKALKGFLDRTGVNMIQWRNMNYDPLRYFRELKADIRREEMIGIDALISMIGREYPGIMHGYFNPSKTRMARHAA